MAVNARAILYRTAALVAVALLGGLVALGGVALMGDLGGGTTTVVRTSASPRVAAAPVADNNGLSVREIYSTRRAGCRPDHLDVGQRGQSRPAPRSRPVSRPRSRSRHWAPASSSTRPATSSRTTT